MTATHPAEREPTAQVQVQLGDWATLGADAAAIRKAVFVDEQGIPADFMPEGAAFNEAGIAHQAMRLLLQPGSDR